MIDDIAEMSPGRDWGLERYTARSARLGLIEPLAPNDRHQPYRLTVAGQLSFAPSCRRFSILRVPVCGSWRRNGFPMGSPPHRALSGYVAGAVRR